MKGEKTCQAAPVPAGNSNSPFAVGMSEAVFQLRYCGDVLQRDAPGQLDPRVVTFNPDLWQRKVLDAIDSGNCLSPVYYYSGHKACNLALSISGIRPPCPWC